MQTTIPFDKVDQIDVEDLMKDFRVMDVDGFSFYLKEVWRVIIMFYI